MPILIEHLNSLRRCFFRVGSGLTRKYVTRGLYYKASWIYRFRSKLVCSTENSKTTLTYYKLYPFYVNYESVLFCSTGPRLGRLVMDRSLPEWSTFYAPGLTNKHLTRLERLVMDRSLPEWSTFYAPGLTHKHLYRLERSARDNTLAYYKNL